MISSVHVPRFEVDVPTFDARYDVKPFGFSHNLAGLDLLSFSALRRLAEKYVGAHEDYFVASGAPAAGTRFYSVAHAVYQPHEALDLLESGQQRVLMKRPEKYDSAYRDLVQTLFAQVNALRGWPRETILRLDSSILISSAQTITPFHFDPEVSFFFQIAGDKEYCVYTPDTLSEPELEAFYQRGVLDIGQVAFEGRDESNATTFALTPGKGLHQPKNAPHWVRTKSTRSISYVFSFETARSRALGRTRAFNFYERKLGIVPSTPGTHPALDVAKANAMRAVIRLRDRASTLVRKRSRS